MTDVTRQELGQFQIRTLLLLIVVAATVTNVFLMPQPMQETLGGALVVESFYRTVNTNAGNGPIVNVECEHGPWRLHTLAGHILAEGGHLLGSSHGEWQYFDLTGQKIASGMVDEGRMVGHWTTWYDSEQKRCEAEFADPAQRSWPVSLQSVQIESAQFGWHPNPGDQREGTVVWWAPSGRVEGRQTYRCDIPLISGNTLADQSRSNSNNAHPNGSYRDRCAAIRRAQFLGSAGVPQLLSLLRSESLPLQRRALAALESIGPAAVEAVKPIAAIARQAQHPLAIEAAFTLASIDQDKRQHWLSYLADATVNDKPALANDLSIVICASSKTIADLEPLISDSRSKVRRLAAAMLLNALKHASHAPVADTPSADEQQPWHAPSFGFGPIHWSPRYNEWRQNSSRERAAEVVRHLELLEDDPDAEIQSAVAEPLKRLRSKELVLGAPSRTLHGFNGIGGSIGTGGFF